MGLHVLQVLRCHSPSCHARPVTVAHAGSLRLHPGHPGQQRPCSLRTVSNAAHPRCRLSLQHESTYGPCGVLYPPARYFACLPACMRHVVVVPRFAACTPYTSLWKRRHRRSQLVGDALRLMDAQGVPRPPNAVPLLRSMAANMHSGWWGLRLFAYALSWLYRYVSCR